MHLKRGCNLQHYSYNHTWLPASSGVAEVKKKRTVSPQLLQCSVIGVDTFFTLHNPVKTKQLGAVCITTCRVSLLQPAWYMLVQGVWLQTTYFRNCSKPQPAETVQSRNCLIHMHDGRRSWWWMPIWQPKAWVSDDQFEQFTVIIWYVILINYFLQNPTKIFQGSQNWILHIFFAHLVSHKYFYFDHLYVLFIYLQAGIDLHNMQIQLHNCIRASVLVPLRVHQLFFKLFVGAALQACFVRHANPETEVGFSWAMQMGTWTR